MFPFWRSARLEDIKLKAWLPAKGRELVQVAVIDDEPFPKSELLRSHGFRLSELGDITDVRMLREFEVILCDIRNVGKAFGSEYEGAYTIAEIRRHYPVKYLILCSAHTFDARYNKFTRLCDDQLRKSADIDTMADALDRGIRVSVDPVERWKRMRTFLMEQGMDLEKLRRLETSYIKAVKRGDSSEFKDSAILPTLSSEQREVLTQFVVSGLIAASKHLIV